MKRIKKILYVIMFLFIDVLLCASLYFIIDAANINNLKKEVKELTNLNMSIDRYNRKSKTIFKYKVVETTIKDYFDSFTVRMNDIYNIVNDEDFIKILSYDNYLNDGPEFNNSINYINDNKKRFNDIVDEMIYDLDENNIKELIRKKINDEYYISLYDKMIFNEDFVKQYEENRVLLDEIKNKYNNRFDVCLEIINFLKLYKDNWKLEDGEIKFSNEDLYNYYSILISKVNSK